jgi:hypothetical protein
MHGEQSARSGIAFGGLLIALGGVLLGLQVDANGKLSGTGFTSLAIGTMLALGALFVRARDAGRIPRDMFGLFAACAAFLAIAFIVAGVLAPGGPWMFFEVFLAIGFVTLRRAKNEAGRWIDSGTLLLFAGMLLFRTWVSYQGSRYNWQVASIDVPVLSWLPFEFLDPLKHVSLGSFTPHELGFPPAGLSFAPTMSLWSLGFALCAGGLVLLQTAAREHENDRIHDLMSTLPPEVGRFVERLIPEEEWHDLGLHGLSGRRLVKRIEVLIGERMRKQRELQSALDASRLLGQTNPGGVSGEIFRAIVDADSERKDRA